MLNVRILCAVATVTVTLGLMFAGPADAKTRVTIKNCSEILYLTYQSYNPWDDKRKLTYQFGRGLAYPVNYRETDYVECASKNWFKKWDSCWVRIKKAYVADTTQMLKGGNYVYRGGEHIYEGTRC